MNMLTSYDHAMSALSTALKSKEVSVVLKSRDDLDLIKMRARQLRDRQLLADATEFQMRVERWLGVLLNEGKRSGLLREQGSRGKAANQSDDAPRAATLKEIGVDGKLAMKARQAAALNQKAFDATVSDMRTRMASGKAKLAVAVNDAEKKPRSRHTHATSHFNILLADGTPLGRVKLGKLRSRIEQIAIEIETLREIGRRVGPVITPMATVEDSVSELVLGDIVKFARRLTGSS